MPGRWVGGKGSKASPTKGQYIEGEAVDADGNDDGLVLIRVKRLYSPGEQGRTVLADYISGSTRKFRAWIETDEGKPAKFDGAYHFCSVEAGTCTAYSRSEICVHIGKWRSWKEEELIDRGIPEFGRQGNLLISQFFKMSPEGGGTTGGLPWGGRKPTGELKLGTGGPRSKGVAEPEAPKGSIQKALAAEGKKRKAISQLEKQLADLKKDVKEAPPLPMKRKTAKKAAAKDKRGHGEDERPFSGEPKKKRRGEPDASPSPDWGGDDDEEDSEDDSSPGDKSDEEEDGREGSRGRDDKDPDKGKGTGGDDKGRKDRGRKKEKKKKKDDKRKKKKRKKKARMEKDKGPFGVGESKKMRKDSSSSESSEADDSGSSSQSFRKAPSGLTLHLRLQRYAMKHPGRLASRLLQKMEKATRFEGARRRSGAGNQVVPCAVNFFLAIMTPSLKDKWTPRTQRELRIWTEVLDCLAAKEYAAAADIAAQRVKALEQSVQDGNQWRKAKFLELVDSEEVTLADRGEANMMQKEVELEDKLKGKGHWNPPNWEKKGKGGKDGKGKDGKGKKDTPAGEAAKKGDK